MTDLCEEPVKSASAVGTHLVNESRSSALAWWVWFVMCVAEFALVCALLWFGLVNILSL